MQKISPVSWKSGLRRAALAVVALVAASPARAEPPAAYDVRIESADGAGGRETRLIFSLNACVAHQAYVLDQPPRAVLDLPEVKFLIDPSHGDPASAKRKSRRAAKPATHPAPPHELSYRFGRLSPGKSRIIVDLPGPAQFSAACAPKKDGGELTLVIKPAETAAFGAAARAGAESQEQARRDATAAIPARAPDAQRDFSKPLIVLDPGHGGVDAGTIGQGDAVEKDVVLDFAKALAGPLRASGRYRVAFTREDDAFVPLQERVRIARKLGAALFVSLHADSLSGGSQTVRGATVYTVSDRASDAEAARVAASENQADSLAGLEQQEQAGEVNDILFDLTRRETRAYSNIFARYLRERWKIAATLNKNPQRHAGFVVLKAPDVPSVLLELGYLSSNEDAVDLTSPQWREKAAAQAALAIDDFFRGRPTVATPAALTEAPRTP